MTDAERAALARASRVLSNAAKITGNHQPARPATSNANERSSLMEQTTPPPRTSRMRRLLVAPRTRLALTGVLSLLVCGLLVVLQTPAMALLIGIALLLIIMDLFNIWHTRKES